MAVSSHDKLLPSSMRKWMKILWTCTTLTEISALQRTQRPPLNPTTSDLTQSLRPNFRHVSSAPSSLILVSRIIKIGRNLKGRSFWLVKAAASSSWIWKKLLRLRLLAKPLIKFVVGNGSRVLLWLDNWHPKGVLASVYSQHTIFNLEIPLTAFLSVVIRDGHWAWPPARTHEMLEIQHSAAQIHPSLTSDTIVWLPSKSQNFSLCCTWNYLRASKPKVPWFHLIWYKNMIPRTHLFAGWQF